MASDNSPYKDLIVWEKSIRLVLNIYNITRKFPLEEKYLLTTQLRRAAVSIPSNIAEGSRRKSKKELRRFLLISFGSGAEIETQLIIALKLKYINSTEYNNTISILTEIMKILNSLITKFS